MPQLLNCLSFSQGSYLGTYYYVRMSHPISSSLSRAAVSRQLEH